MRILIDIDEEIYKARQHWVANPKKMVDQVDIAIANGIPIPDNATNGDIIKALFPNATIHIFECLNSVNVITDETLNAQTFDLDWWNAPYQKGGK